MSFVFTNGTKTLRLPWQTADELIALMASLGVPDPGEPAWETNSWCPEGYEKLAAAMKEGRIKQKDNATDSMGRTFTSSWTVVTVDGPDPLDEHNQRFVDELLEFLKPVG